eukprot:scaffold119345_cov72-Phaeocystis_antarctica.AAC.5
MQRTMPHTMLRTTPCTCHAHAMHMPCTCHAHHAARLECGEPVEQCAAAAVAPGGLGPRWQELALVGRRRTLRVTAAVTVPAPTAAAALAAAAAAAALLVTAGAVVALHQLQQALLVEVAALALVHGERRRHDMAEAVPRGCQHVRRRHRVRMRPAGERRHGHGRRRLSRCICSSGTGELLPHPRHEWLGLLRAAILLLLGQQDDGRVGADAVSAAQPWFGGAVDCRDGQRRHVLRRQLLSRILVSRRKPLAVATPRRKELDHRVVRSVSQIRLVAKQLDGRAVLVQPSGEDRRGEEHSS